MHEELRDVVVVGAGFSGLAAAYELADLDPVVLEEQDILGGRGASIIHDPYWVNLGAHLLNSAPGETDQLCSELGLQRFDIPAGPIVVEVARTRIEVRGIFSAIFELPVSLRSKVQLLQLAAGSAFFWLLRRMFNKSARRPIASEKLTTDAATIVKVVLARLGIDPNDAELSAFFDVLWYASKRHQVILGGIGELASGMSRSLAGVVTNAKVTEVVGCEVGDQPAVAVSALVEGESITFYAKTCIVSVPAPIAGTILGSARPSTLTALRRVEYGKYLVVGLFTHESDGTPWDHIYTTVAGGRAFSYAFNTAYPTRQQESWRAPGGSITAYAAGPKADKLWAKSDDDIVREVIRDIGAVYEFDLARVVGEWKVQRHQFGAPLSRLDQIVDQPVMKGVYLTGDYLSGIGVEPALRHGREVAQLVRSTLQSDRVSADDRADRFK